MISIELHQLPAIRAIILLLCGTYGILGSAILVAQESPNLKKAPESNRESNPLEGAESPEQAIEKFAKASAEANLYAAECMIDPELRPLLQPEMVIDRIFADTLILASLVAEKEKSPRKRFGSGVPIAFAERDLIRSEKIEILDRTVIDEQRIRFQVLCETESYDADGSILILDDLMTIKRADRWYVVRLIGMQKVYFSDSFMADIDHGESKETTIKMPIQTVGAEPGRTLRRNADAEVIYHVPIQRIHEELIGLARKTDAQQLIGQIREIDGLHRGLRVRVLDGKIKSMKELDLAMKPLETRMTATLKTHAELLRSVSQKLTDLQKAAPSKP